MDLARQVSANGGGDFKSPAATEGSGLSFAFGIQQSGVLNLTHFGAGRKNFMFF